MALKGEDSMPGQASASTAAAAAAVTRSASAAAAAGVATAPRTKAAAASSSAAGAAAGQSKTPAVGNKQPLTQRQAQKQPSQTLQKAGEGQQAERRHKRKAAEPQRAVSPCIVGFATQEARRTASQQQGVQPAQHAAQQQGVQPPQHATARALAPQLPLPRKPQALPPLPPYQQQQALPLLPAHPQQQWQVAQLQQQQQQQQQQLYLAQQQYQAQGWLLPYLPAQQHVDAEQQDRARLHTRPAAVLLQHVQPAPAVRQQPQPQPAAVRQRARVPPMQALIMENYTRLHQQRQEGQRREGQAQERSRQDLHQQTDPMAAPPPRPPPQPDAPAKAVTATSGSGSAPGAARGRPVGQRLQPPVAASSLDRSGDQASSKRQRTALARIQEEQQQPPPPLPLPQQAQRQSKQPQQQQQARQQQQAQQRQQQPQQQQAQKSQQQQPPGSPKPMPLYEAAQVSTGKWEALTAVSAALAELERSAPSAAAKQAQLDGALFAALRHNRCPPACVAVVKMLLEAGASATGLDSSGPPLQAFLLSCESWRWSEEEMAGLVKTLLAAGASATERDGQGLTPCERAVRMWSDAAVRGALKTLAAAGADLLEVDSRGRTLLHHAAAFSVGSKGLEAAVELLLEEGCDPLAVDTPDGKDTDGKLALELLDSKPGRSTGATARLLAEGIRARSASEREAAAALRAQQGSQQRCVVCMQRQRTVALLPCGHFGFCATCAAASTACPLCCQRVSARPTIHTA